MILCRLIRCRITVNVSIRVRFRSQITDFFCLPLLPNYSMISTNTFPEVGLFKVSVGNSMRGWWSTLPFPCLFSCFVHAVNTRLDSWNSDLLTTFLPPSELLYLLRPHQFVIEFVGFSKLKNEAWGGNNFRPHQFNFLFFGFCTQKNWGERAVR
jgi:hypothetical protein